MLTGSLIFGFIVFANAAAQQDSIFTALIKRQEPGTPAYACHEACGIAVTLSKGTDPCSNAEFTTQYKTCLQCAGPDDVNIWRYYGGTLGKAGAACGLDTQPRAGSQSGESSATQGESQSASSSVMVVGSGAAVLVSSSSASTSGRATEESTAASSTSDIVSRSTGVSTVTSPVEPSTNAAAAAAARLDGADSGSGIFGAIFVAALFGM